MDIQVFVSEMVKCGFIVGGGIYIFFWFIGYCVNSSFSMFEYITKK